jgi:hypothetical protein
VAERDPFETAMLQGAVRALRRRTERQASLASAGTVTAGERFPNVKIRTGEASIAGRLAAALSDIADELEEEAAGVLGGSHRGRRS